MEQPSVATGHSWPIYHGDNAASHSSPLSEINRTNVQDLRLVWSFRAGDHSSSTTIQCNPIVVDDRMYLVSPGLKAVALNAVTGEELWRFNPFEEDAQGGNSRGLTYYAGEQDQRIFYAAGTYLYALDANSGEVIAGFGQSGRVDLRQGLTAGAQGMTVNATTPGIIFENLLILGSRVGEGPSAAAPGYIRAYNTATGNIAWTFKTIPDQGEPGSDTWSAETRSQMGGANSWGGFSLDEDRGMVFCGTGSASYDHWGGNRIGTNLFANCVLALDARTGERKWHYQVVHHDIWDYDVPCQPNLVQIERRGRRIDAVAQATKMGHLFVLDRETGKPLHPVAEVRVPQSKIPGEQSWPTQPFPIVGLRYAQQSFEQEDITNISAEANSFVKDLTSEFIFGDIFLPPSETPTMTIPQFNGGTDWGGAAYDSSSRSIIVNCSNEAEWISMERAQIDDRISHFDLGEKIFRSTCQSCHSQKEGGGAAPSFAAMREASLAATDAEFYSTVRSGKGLMPGFIHFTDQELQAMYAYVSESGKGNYFNRGELEMSYAEQVPWIATGHNELKDDRGFPANKPPWGTLTSINLDEAKINWQVPLGTYPALEREGHPPTGTFNMGGPVVTAGGLVFIAATMDERIRAFDKDTGEKLWEHQLDAGGYSTPSTYAVDGKQYLIIGAGGGGKPGTKSGQAYQCFALP